MAKSKQTLTSPKWTHQNMGQNILLAKRPPWNAPEGNHGSCIHHLGLDICFDEYNYHDSLQARHIKGIGHFALATFRALFTALVALSCDWRLCHFSGEQRFWAVFGCDQFVSWLLQHDTTVSALLSALDVYDGIAPAYSSAVMIELFSDENDNK